MSWQKTCADWLTDSFSELAGKGAFLESASHYPHTENISRHSVCGAFKDSSETSARSDSIQRHPDSLSGAVTHSQTQTGGRGATAPCVSLCAKKRERRKGWNRQTTQTNSFFSFSPTTLTRNLCFLTWDWTVQYETMSGSFIINPWDSQGLGKTVSELTFQLHQRQAPAQCVTQLRMNKSAISPLWC